MRMELKCKEECGSSPCIWTLKWKIVRTAVGKTSAIKERTDESYSLQTTNTDSLYTHICRHYSHAVFAIIIVFHIHSFQGHQIQVSFTIQVYVCSHHSTSQYCWTHLPSHHAADCQHVYKHQIMCTTIGLRCLITLVYQCEPSLWSTLWINPDGCIPVEGSRWRDPHGGIPVEGSWWRDPDGGIPVEGSQWRDPSRWIPVDGSVVL